MRIPLLALRLLFREWRAGELRLLAAALVLAVGSMTAVGFFTDRIHQALGQQAAELLGADLVIATSRGLPPALRQRATALGLGVAQVLEFPSMALASGRSQLVTVAAVSDAYPLRGTLLIASWPFASARPVRGAPPAGSVWVESGLLAALGISVGDRLQLGEAQLRVAAVLVNEPARVSGTLFSIAPRLMLSLADLPATGLVQPASRVHYRFLVAGPPAGLAAFRAVAQQALLPGERVTGSEEGRPEIRMALQRARHFLGLAALIGVILAGIAMAMATRRFMVRHVDACGLLRCLGCGRGELLALYLLQLTALALAGGLAGCLLGWLVQYGLVAVLGSLVVLDLPPPSWLPLAVGMLAALVMVAGFALPLLLHLPRVPALRVLRRELGEPPPQGRLAAVAGLAAFAALVLWQAGDWRLAGYMLGGVLLTLLLLMVAALLSLLALGRWRVRLPRTLRFAVRSLRRQLSGSVLQVASFGIGIAVLLLLVVVRGVLLAGWRASLPVDTPNRFLINIRPQQVAEVQAFFRRHGVSGPVLYPVVRGRLTAIGGRKVMPDSFQDEQARRLVAREFNLSWMAALPAHNRLTAGRWWSGNEADDALFSVEAGLARTLDIQLGDELFYRVAGREIRGRVINLREVEWDSFQVNFFVVAPPALLEGLPTSYICSIYLPPGRTDLLGGLVRRFVNITVIDVAAIMDQVRLVMERVSLAVEYVFFFTLVAGLLVLYAAIQSTLDERVREFAVMRTLGAGRGLLLRSLLAEFAVLGLLAGLIAVLAAAALGYVLAESVFEVPFLPSWHLLLGGALLAALGIGAAGYLGTRSVLRRPPLQTLQERA
ncbi:MAG: ABC transporter permease [Gammaproteobacteria bacterium]